MGEDLKKLAKVFQKRLWILLLIPIVAVATSCYLSIYVIEPSYESTTTLIVINQREESANIRGVSYDDLLIGEELVKNYKEIIKSRTVTSTVIKELNLENMTSGVLTRRIEAEAKNDTSIIEVKVKGRSPEEANLINEKLCEVFNRTVFNLWENRNVKIIDHAEASREPVSPNLKLNIALAVIAGLLTSTVIILLLEYFDDTIKTTEEAEERLGIPVLGIVPNLRMR